MNAKSPFLVKRGGVLCFCLIGLSISFAYRNILKAEDSWKQSSEFLGLNFCKYAKIWSQESTSVQLLAVNALTPDWAGCQIRDLICT